MNLRLKRTGADAPLAPFIISLALIAFIVPLAIDLYVPGMPTMSKEFSVSDGQVQMTLAVYLLAMALGQIIFGPLSDAYGRRRPLFTGLGVFFLGALLCALTPDFRLLLLFRFIQGLGGSATVVVMYSAIRDRAQGPRAAKLYSVVVALGAIAPVLGPGIGGLIVDGAGWRWSFVAMALSGLLVMLLASKGMAESLAVENRTSFPPPNVGRIYLGALSNKRFIIPALGLSLLYAMLFVVVGGSPFVLQQSYGLSPSTYGLAFSALAVSMAIAAPVAGWLSGRFGEKPIATISAAVVVVGSIGTAMSLDYDAKLWILLSALFVLLVGLGMAEPTLASMSMSAAVTNIGSHAAVLGTLQYTLSALAIPLSGAALDGSTTAWGVLLLLIAAAAFIMVVFSNRALDRIETH